MTAPRRLWRAPARTTTPEESAQQPPPQRKGKSSPRWQVCVEGIRSYRRLDVTLGHCSDQEPGDGIEEEGNAKEDQRQRSEDPGVDGAGGLSEFVRDHRWQ